MAFILSFDTTVEVTAVTGEPRSNDTFNIGGPTFFSVNNSAGGVLQRGPLTFVAGIGAFYGARRRRRISA